MANPLKTIFDFRPRELPVAGAIFAAFFFSVAIFQINKALKKGLFVEYYGADLELYAKLGNIAAAALAALVFSYLYRTLSRSRLILVLSLFFAVSFALLVIALQNPGPWSICTYYLIGDLVTTLLVVGLWAYLTDISSTDQAGRLFGVIGGGLVIGGWVGIASARALLSSIGMNGLLLSSAVMAALIGLIIIWTESEVKRGGVFGSRQEPQKEPDTPSKSGMQAAIEGARMVLRSPYLAAIVGIMASYELASQIMDYQFTVHTEALSGVESTQQFIINVYFYANCLSVFVQFVLVSVIIRKLGLLTALLVLPLAITLSSLAFLAVPTLIVASFLVISDNGLNYSIQQTSRESLYIVTTPEEKYQARAFTNMFVQRFAKGIAIITIVILGQVGTAPRYLSILTLAVMVLMIACSLYAGRRFSRKAATAGT